MANICTTPSCHRAAAVGKKLCTKCADRGKQYKQARIAAGLCARCGSQPPTHGRCCADCRAWENAYARAWRAQANAEKTYKGIVYRHYGTSCSCCGESNELFLTIDHLEGRKNNGDRGLSGLKLYMRLAKRIMDGNPRSDIRILCYNCNCGRARNDGVCPHVTVAHA